MPTMLVCMCGTCALATLAFGTIITMIEYVLDHICQCFVFNSITQPKQRKHFNLFLAIKNTNI